MSYVTVKPCGTLTLMKQDKDCLMGGHELTDNDINFAQLLLKSQFPDIDGFRNKTNHSERYPNAPKLCKSKLSLGMHSFK